MPRKDNTVLEAFIKSSIHTSPQYIKRLKFIYSAVYKYAQSNNKSFEELEILEFGCGQGGITFPLASLGSHITAFDIDASAVSDILERVRKENLNNITVQQADGHSFDDNRSYDLVIASEVLEHSVNPEEFVRRIRAQLKKGGWLVITIPNGYGPWQIKRRLSVFTHLRRNNRLRHILGKQPYFTGQDHCQFYSKKRFLRMLSGFSFRLKDFGKSDSILAIFETRRGPLFGKADVRLADILPWWLASGWYFVFEAGQQSGQRSPGVSEARKTG